MPTTNYSSVDLFNIIATSGPAFTNCSDIGSAPLTPNFSGSFSDVAYHRTVDQAQDNRCEGSGIWTASVNHSTPTTIVPSNAQIRKVTIRMQFVNNPQSASITAVFANGNPSPFPVAQTSNTITFQVGPVPLNSTWISSQNNINASATDSETDGVNLSASSTLTPGGAFVFKEYDFTVNPAGAFPLGYMTYASFITNFSTVSFAMLTLSTVHAAWGIGGQPGTATIDGNDSGSCFLQAANWEMEVEWMLPSSWTLSPATLNLPNNVVTLTRPEPIGDEDTEQIEKIQIGDTIIEPNDPWVIIWTRLEIRFHLPTDENYDDPDIELFFVGTEFSGAVAFLPLTINYADLSGLYQLDDSIHHDILYNRTSTPTTQNVLIPAPFFVTYFADTPETDISHCNGTRIGISGQGIVKQVLQSIDYINTLQFGNVALKTTNNRSPFSIANFIDQHTSVRVYMDGYDDFMKVDQIIIFIKPVFTGYPQ